MKRLLCIVGGMNTGGAETFLMKVYRSLDLEKYQMDFCVSKKEKGYYDDEIKKMGGKIIRTTAKSKNPFKSFCSLYKIVKANNYKYVMRVSQHSLSTLELLAAKLGGAKILVFRSSNSNTMKKGLTSLIHKLFSFLPKTIPNVKIAPSIPAAEFMFGKKQIKKGKVLLLNNGIPLENFDYQNKEREKIRKELKIDKDTMVVGHIGRFAEQKNHKKLIEIFEKINKKIDNSVLLLVGEGEKQEEIKKDVISRGLEKKVIFLGIRSDIPKLLSVFDVFVFPSFYEGMPNTIIEAQANGLPCLIADTITSEVCICSSVHMLSLDKSSEEWANEAINIAKRENNDNIEKLRKYGYDINDVVKVFVNNVFEKEE